MARARIHILAAVAALGLSCRSGPPPAIDPVLGQRVPAGATLLAGANLDRLRASSLYRQLPPAAVAFLAPLSSARSLVAASDGSRYLVLVRGDFREAPAGSTLITKGLAAAGPTDWIEAARHGAGKNGLLVRAEPVAASADIWMAADGSANLPLTGNGENFSRLLHATKYATLSLRLTDSVALEVVGTCARAETAVHLEETVRAFAGVGAGAAMRQPTLAAILRRINVTRDGLAVRVAVRIEGAEIPALLEIF